MAERISSASWSNASNILMNHDFSDGLNYWYLNCCNGYVISASAGDQGGISMDSDQNYTVITERNECWQGLGQDITDRISIGFTYTVSAFVGVSGPSQESAEVKATLKLEYDDSATQYLFIGRTSVVKGSWEKLEATFSLSTVPNRAVFYLEGPAPGVDLLIKSVVINCSSPNNKKATHTEGCVSTEDENIIINPQFEDGLNNWFGRSCKIVLTDSMADGKIVPKFGKFFASAAERTQAWNGIQQEITGRVQRKLAYEMTALVRIYGNNVTSADVKATLWVQTPDLREQYIGIANVQATDTDWVTLQGKFLLNGSSSKVVLYLEGPPPGTDILVNTLVVKHAAKATPSTPLNNVAFGVNIIENSNLLDDTSGWFTLGDCTLTVKTESPLIVPPIARDSLGRHETLSGHYLLVTNRAQTWNGPAQVITEKLKLFVTYQVSAWVRIGSGSNRQQNVNVAISADNQWINGGQTEVSDNRWHDLNGSFRIEKQPSKVTVYIQGPASGIDLMVAGLQIFPVDRQARFTYLKTQTDKIRKREVTLKFSGLDSSSYPNTTVNVTQTRNDFQIGTCISRSNIDNEDFVNFLVKHFNWAVFRNELTWEVTEPQKGILNYKDADDLLSLCQKYNIQTRGHCIFWEMDKSVQQWIKSLNKKDLMTAVQNRLTGLLTRYKGKFNHYDVNNEMLHGSFYQDRLGKDIRANMFKTAHQLDSSATLFVNDYHIEDGCDTTSCPEKYIQHILDLLKQDAPVGGIGIQGHINSPIGPIVHSSLDKLGVFGLPIWFTELDVSSMNEHVRADDLEVMLREAYAHPAVEGIMLWGFWELLMSRENAHLVNAEGDINEAGKRFLALKQEWLSHTHGHVDEEGHFKFKGFYGTYDVEIVTPSKKIAKSFVLYKGDNSLVVPINL
ncbi:endo-1,4-beta-xylanase A-like protein [Trifolium pratense]|uniref:Endo-1,4-beta-xylanase A-like protein n=1 Tax=Trifolium pratense TaxID=57577 RepID=A0A2K3PDD3_TRIPR|nr:endo-1,4-beta-xylanase A-like protein [Trifolium pratense]